MALLALALISAAPADEVDYTYTVTSGSDWQACGNSSVCSPIVLSLPQYNPSLGTLDAVTWTFSDFQQYYGGYNDTADIANPGQLFSYTTTEGDQNALLGLDAFNSQTITGYTCSPSCRNVSVGGWWSYNSLQASGTASDLAPFVGIGTVDINILPFLSASLPPGSPWMQASLDETINDITLTVTYKDAPAVPEPRWTAGIAGLLLVGCLAFRKLRPTQT